MYRDLSIFSSPGCMLPTLDASHQPHLWDFGFKCFIGFLYSTNYYLSGLFSTGRSRGLMLTQRAFFHQNVRGMELQTILYKLERFILRNLNKCLVRYLWVFSSHKVCILSLSSWYWEIVENWSNLNSNLLRFHCAHPILHTYFRPYNIIG